MTSTLPPALRSVLRASLIAAAALWLAGCPPPDQELKNDKGAARTYKVERIVRTPDKERTGINKDHQMAYLRHEYADGSTLYQKREKDAFSRVSGEYGEVVAETYIDRNGNILRRKPDSADLLAEMRDLDAKRPLFLGNLRNGRREIYTNIETLVTREPVRTAADFARPPTPTPTVRPPGLPPATKLPETPIIAPPTPTVPHHPPP